MSFGRWINSITGNGSAVVGATITVYQAGTSTLATLYADVLGATPMSNPTATDSEGSAYFYAVAPGSYDIVISKQGFEDKTLSAEIIVPIDPAARSRVVTDDYTISASTDRIIEGDCSSKNIVLTTPVIAFTAAGQEFGVKKTDATENTLTLNDENGNELFVLNVQEQGYWFYYNGTTWKKSGVM